MNDYYYVVSLKSDPRAFFRASPFENGSVWVQRISSLVNTDDEVFELASLDELISLSAELRDVNRDDVHIEKMRIRPKGYFS